MDRFSFTSHELLDRLSRHCPEAISAYLHCISRANDEGKVVFERQQVSENMCESWIKFRNHIRKLALEGVLEYHLLEEYLHVTLAIDLEDNVDFD